MDIYEIFLKRIELGEIDPGENFNERTKNFSKELIENTEKGLITAKQAAVLWLYHLRRLGYNVEIPDIT